MKKLSKEEVFRDVYKNHNNSWIVEIFERNKNRMDYTAITYRGLKISYSEFKEKVEEYTKALRAQGLKKGDRFLVSIPNTPEYIYFLGAASAIGAVIDIVSPEFDKDYLKRRINKTNYDKVFISDMHFAEMKDVLKEVDKDVVLVPHENSLPNGNPYEEITSKYYQLDKEELHESMVDYGRPITHINDFINSGKDYSGPVIENHGLEQQFTITYSSGSTNSARPKAIVHNAKSYVFMGRYHDQDVSDYPTMKKATTLAMIPSHSNTDINNCISDTLMEGGTVACEPIYNDQYYLDSLLINKPTLALATRSFWLSAMKKYYTFKEMYKNLKLPFMLVPASVGEPLAVNEEKALNKWLRKVKTGINFVPSALPIVCMSIGGGDCEHGGILFTLFRALQSKRIRKNITKEPIGMKVYNMVDIVALRPDGTHCEPYEAGELVCNSPCTMVEYDDNEEENNNFHIKDAYGHDWTKMSTYGYTDGNGYVYVKGRIHSNPALIPEYIVADTILKDTKNILSCEVVLVPEENEYVYVAHIEPQLDRKLSNASILKSAYDRCVLEFGQEFADKLQFRFRSNSEGFPLTGCGKRDNVSLIREGICNTISFEKAKAERTKIRKRA